MKRSLFLKIFGGYLILTVALSGLIVLISSYLIRDYQIERTAQELKDIAIVIGTRTMEMPSGTGSASTDRFVKEMGKRINTRITLVAPDGKVIADSEEDPGRMENHRTRIEIAQAFEGGTGRFLRVSETLGQEMLYIAVPVQREGKTMYVLRVSKFLKDIKTVSRELNTKILLITVVVLVAALIGAFIFARTIYRPIGELSAAIRRVASHDFSTRVLLREQDELKEVADSFNDMTDEMQDLFSDLTAQKEELNSIISSLQEGLLVLDREEQVLLINDSLKTLMGPDVEIGRPYWEVIREPALNELVNRVHVEKTNHIGEITINGAVFLCSATFLGSKEEMVLVFHDITEIRKLEKVKSDFVLNVSHELRTPLTSIKGFVETMEMEGSLSDEQRHYLMIVKRNTARLINVVSDLLALSRLEEKNPVLELEPLDMPELVEGVLKIFEEQIRAKGFFVEVRAAEELLPVMGDAFKLEQVFVNLFDNAIKYTDAGGITVEMETRDNTVVISVADTGQGIPSEHIDRIFERFYVVDKSRSKKLGGTGLGLSIVKHIILLHNGKITVQSSPGKGTRFVITLPARDRLSVNA
ncbi:MAG: ATP-binding protein [Syntrophorhabdaceae bacterium]|nr:ATP-binding protein [Syntrophorhabdaceae bacterium]